MNKRERVGAEAFEEHDARTDERDEFVEKLIERLGNSQNELKRVKEGSAQTKDALLDQIVRMDEHSQEQHDARMFDDLTGLHNREAFVKRFEEITAIPPGGEHRRSQPRSLIMFDLDKFKEVNDEYGHEPADSVLQQFSDFLRKVFRSSDFIARRSGDEFLVIADIAPSVLIERWREQEGDEAKKRPAQEASLPFSADIPSLKNPQERTSLDVTFSAGVVELLPGAKLAEMLARVEDAMHDAKRAGKNRIWAEEKNFSEEGS